MRTWSSTVREVLRGLLVLGLAGCFDEGAKAPAANAPCTTDDGCPVGYGCLPATNGLSGLFCCKGPGDCGPSARADGGGGTGGSRAIADSATTGQEVSADVAAPDTNPDTGAAGGAGGRDASLGTESDAPASDTPQVSPGGTGGQGGESSRGGAPGTGGAGSGGAATGGGAGAGAGGAGGFATGGASTGGSVGSGGAGAQPSTGGRSTGGVMGTGGAGTGGAPCGSSTDVQNCGTCGRVCPGPSAGSGSATCVAGTCGIDCGTGALCGTACVDLAGDINNCRQCGRKCPAPTAGSGSPICTVAGCDFNCSGTTPNKCDGACVNIATSPTNCGACGVVCASTAQCKAGSSSSSCVCNQGYTGTGTVCTVEDECSTGNHRCGVTAYSGVCATGAGLGYSCTCNTGFTNSGGSFAQCYKSGTLTFGGSATTGTWSYEFMKSQSFNSDFIQSGDFYVISSDSFHKVWANNTGQGGVQKVDSTAALLDVPVPKTDYWTEGVAVENGATYVSKARSTYPNYYIVFRVTAVPASGFTMDWVLVYRP